MHNPTGAVFGVDYRLSGRALACAALWFTVIVGACVACAYLFHRAIERPSLRLSYRVALNPRSLP